jgi:hypothetical protein
MCCCGYHAGNSQNAVIEWRMKCVKEERIHSGGWSRVPSLCHLYTSYAQPSDKYPEQWTFNCVSLKCSPPSTDALRKDILSEHTGCTNFSVVQWLWNVPPTCPQSISKTSPHNSVMTDGHAGDLKTLFWYSHWFPCLFGSAKATQAIQYSRNDRWSYNGGKERELAQLA